MLSTSDFVLRRPLPTLQPSSITGTSVLIADSVPLTACTSLYPQFVHVVFPQHTQAPSSLHQSFLLWVNTSRTASGCIKCLAAFSPGGYASVICAFNLQTPKSANIQCSPLAESALTDLVCVKERMPQRIQRTNAFLRLQRQHPLQQI